MEVIRGRESDCRQEIRSAVERGGTRPTRRVDPQRQAFRPVAGEGPHPAEGGRIGARRRLERQPDCRGAGHQYPHYRADQAPAGRGGVRGGVEAQIQSQFRPAPDFRRRSRSKIDRADPLSGPGGFRPLEPPPARGEGRRTAHCRARQRQHDRADAKKNILKPHRKQQWVIPPDASAAFVANMEDVLEVYQRPHDPQRPLVCLDETSKQLIIETRAPIPAKPGRKARHDYEYERNGVANLFMVFVIVTRLASRLRGDRRARLDDQLLRGFVEAHERTLRIVRPLIDLQHVFHVGHKGRAGVRRDHPLLLAMRFENVFFSVRPIVLLLARSTMCSSTTFSSSRRRLQRAKPSGAGERVSAINFASAAPSKIRGRAELGLYLRLNTASNPSSTSWRLVRSIVGILVSSAAAIRLSLQPSPSSDTSAFSRMRAFVSNCAERLPLRINSSSWARSSALNRTTYFLTAITFPTTNHLHRSLTATEIQKFRHFQ